MAVFADGRLSEIPVQTLITANPRYLHMPYRIGCLNHRHASHERGGFAFAG
jgi:hypothetical protein